MQNNKQMNEKFSPTPAEILAKECPARLEKTLLSDELPADEYAPHPLHTADSAPTAEKFELSPETQAEIDAELSRLRPRVRGYGWHTES